MKKSITIDPKGNLIVPENLEKFSKKITYAKGTTSNGECGGSGSGTNADCTNEDCEGSNNGACTNQNCAFF